MPVLNQQITLKPSSKTNVQTYNQEDIADILYIGRQRQRR
jgi:hypothetical protein